MFELEHFYSNGSIRSHLNTRYLQVSTQLSLTPWRPSNTSMLHNDLASYFWDIVRQSGRPSNCSLQDGQCKDRFFHFWMLHHLLSLVNNQQEKGVEKMSSYGSTLMVSSQSMFLQVLHFSNLLWDIHGWHKLQYPPAPAYLRKMLVLLHCTIECKILVSWWESTQLHSGMQNTHHMQQDQWWR